MMFGDSYKPWHMQFEEYFYKFKDKLSNPLKVETSPNKWIGWGGLKWCSESSFQLQLNREGCQESEPDNSNPRKYSEMVFVANPIVSKKINKIIKECRG